MPRRRIEEIQHFSWVGEMLERLPSHVQSVPEIWRRVEAPICKLMQAWGSFQNTGNCDGLQTLPHEFRRDSCERKIEAPMQQMKSRQFVKHYLKEMYSSECPHACTRSDAEMKAVSHNRNFAPSSTLSCLISPQCPLGW